MLICGFALALLLAAPQAQAQVTVDFTVDDDRIPAGAGVTFTDLTVNANPDDPIVTYDWEFGDGGTSNDQNPVHVYVAVGVYDVKLTVITQSGTPVEETKALFVEVLDTPFVDFVGVTIPPSDPGVTPPTGPAPLSVQFTDRSEPSIASGPAVEWRWDFGDNTASVFQNPTHEYLEDGPYNVTLIVTFENLPDAPATFSRQDYVVVGAPEEVVGVAYVDIIGAQGFDTHALVPLHDWMPMFGIQYSNNEETPGDLTHAYVSYQVFNDPIDSLTRGFYNSTPLREVDIEEFSLWRDMSDPASDTDGGPDGLLDEYDEIIYRWAGDGGAGDEDPSALSYRIPIPIFIGSVPGDVLTGSLVAMRTSARWRNGTSLSYKASVRIDDFEGSPDPTSFDDVDDLDPQTTYSSAFSVWSTAGRAETRDDPLSQDQASNTINQFGHVPFLYTPQGEFTRPRFDLSEDIFDIVTGEWLRVRDVFALEQWVDVLGINLHSANPPLTQDWLPGIGRVIDIGGDKTIGTWPTQFNIIFTDIGGDPFGPPGNGGFDPVQGLDPFTESVQLSANNPVRSDQAFNGVTIFRDEGATGTQGVFDRPEPVGIDGGVDISGTDKPMSINRNVAFLYGMELPLPQWEYIPNPPGGGDPWWKLRLYTGAGRDEGTSPDDYVEPIPDSEPTRFFPLDWEVTDALPVDYFVVMRADSGFADISNEPGDGTALSPGADTRAFIEPRRFNPLTGGMDGGIHVSSMRMPRDGWQDFDEWGAEEPWWPQRTHNPTVVLPKVHGVEVHDLVLTYETSNLAAKRPGIDYRSGRLGFGDYNEGSGEFTFFDQWLDPFGLTRGQFVDGHSVGVMGFGRDTFCISVEVLPGEFVVICSNDGSFRHLPFETVPFFDFFFDQPGNPRSPFYPIPPMQPTLPTYSTWLPFQTPPTALGIGEYPALSDWEPQNRAARILRQRIDGLSDPTAILGFNLVGVDDIRTNLTNQAFLEQITVAFHGPGFSPDSLRTLDSEGQDELSGVALYEDGDRDGVFANPFSADVAVQLSNLTWQNAPELVDTDGDLIPDDLDGDGDVDDDDRAWVLRLTPVDSWELPTTDDLSRSDDDTAKSGLNADVVSEPSVEAPEFWSKDVYQVDAGDTKAASFARAGQEKLLGVDVGNPGDDLFLVIRTSDSNPRFSKFRAIVPATLPERIDAERQAGIQFTPRVFAVPDSLNKSHPEEGAGPKFFGLENLETNISVDIVDFTAESQPIVPGGNPMPIFGLDLTTNRPDGTFDHGTDGRPTGVGDSRTYDLQRSTLLGINEVQGYYLIDNQFEAYAIESNVGNLVTLVSGTPRAGDWWISCDPSFFEQLIVEFYDTERDGEFNILQDFLPLALDQRISGVALYRDNDGNPANLNGQWDPADIPVILDDPPRLVGVPGEPATQVKFVFSSPGTDNLPISQVDQPRLRQWVPDTSGEEAGDPFRGSDFFVVIRPSSIMQLEDDFSAAIMNWGPATPTEPDPDQFTFPAPPLQPADEFDIFSEFPWGARAIGFISLFREPFDDSGFNWIRTSTSAKAHSNVITAVDPVDVDELLITSALPTVLPLTVPAGGISLTISGINFGTAAPPLVTVGGAKAALTVTAFSNTQIVGILAAGVTFSEGPVSLTVVNASNGSNNTRSDLLRASGTEFEDPPRVISVTPGTGTSGDFPVVIHGSDFSEAARVFFNTTEMPVQRDQSSSSRLVVAFPTGTGGVPATGPNDVTVRNDDLGSQATLPAGFVYINDPDPGKGPLRPCFIATAAYGTPFAQNLDVFRSFRDDVLLKTAFGAMLVDVYYGASPAVANAIAERPAVAWLVRVALTPVAWAIQWPGFLMVTLALAVAIRRLTNRRGRRLSAEI
jgi:hypothetical protein